MDNRISTDSITRVGTFNAYVPSIIITSGEGKSIECKNQNGSEIEEEILFMLVCTSKIARSKITLSKWFWPHILDLAELTYDANNHFCFLPNFRV